MDASWRKPDRLREKDMDKFDAPGFLQDFDAAQHDAWSQWISTQFDEARQRNDPGIANYGPRLHFFNPLKNPPNDDAVERDVTWTAFPKIVRIQSISDRQRWRQADSSRDSQDEYCEWSVTRDPQTDKITRATFTSEGPEYWRFLASVNPNKVVELYREHVGPDVRPEHLFQNGAYVERNRWNSSTTNGAMHLIQRNNTLGAEIELSAAATIVRVVDGRTLDAEQELIQCGSYGQPERNSDPRIGAFVNELARAKADITLANPVGLCIAGLSVVGWRTPDNSPASDYWRIVRGTSEKALRAVYEVPPAKGFTVGDIEINGKKIEFGSQIADFITIKLTGLATRLGKSTVAPFHGCVQSAGLAMAVAEPNVAFALAQVPVANRR
jgi:hypothetical protein